MLTVHKTYALIVPRFDFSTNLYNKAAMMPSVRTRGVDKVHPVLNIR
jgi:hypothetical protein